jgi:hypothetical protein
MGGVFEDLDSNLPVKGRTSALTVMGKKGSLMSCLKVKPHFSGRIFGWTAAPLAGYTGH